MIKPEDFYSGHEGPDERSKRRMWTSMRTRLPIATQSPLVMWDRRSFVFGMAASLILGLALYGGYSIARQAFEDAKPEPLRLEQAYVSAIREFERVVPTSTVTRTVTGSLRGHLTQRREQLGLIDEAITELRRQTNGIDLSPLKRERLRQLYSMKLQVLQQMIEEGEIEI